MLQNGEEKNSEAVNALGNLKLELNQLVSFSNTCIFFMDS